MTPGITVAKKNKVSHRLHEYVHDPSSEFYGGEAAEKLVFKTLVVGVIPVSSMLSMKLIARALGTFFACF